MKLEVSTEQLESLAHRLSSQLAGLDHAGDVVSLAPAVAENPRLEAALEGLVETWIGGIHAVQSRLAELSAQLQDAGESYGSAEQRLTTNADVGTSPARPLDDAPSPAT